MPNQPSDDDTTRAVARLPGLDIEVVHRRSAGAEAISIHLKAMPSFAAFGRAFEQLNPLVFWAEAARLAWLPWLEATRALLPPSDRRDTR